jgi:hypothetical protein
MGQLCEEFLSVARDRKEQDKEETNEVSLHSEPLGHDDLLLPRALRAGATLERGNLTDWPRTPSRHFRFGYV